jgi:hypothetical protein
MMEMIPVAALAPLDYRYALDAAMPLLAAAAPQRIICHLPALLEEVAWRLPDQVESGHGESALWIEPPAAGWQDDLAQIASALPKGGPLVVVASRPLARLLPERRIWPAQALGLRPGGTRRLEQGLRLAGFRLREIYGIHTLWSIGLNRLSLAVESRWPVSAACLHFAARLHYAVQGRSSALATVALILAQKQDGATLPQTRRRAHEARRIP